jgi:hypothetical protein
LIQKTLYKIPTTDYHGKTNEEVTTLGRGNPRQKKQKDERGGGVETRKAILDFQYSEKMKSGLIIGTNLLDQLASLKNDEELSGGKKVLVWYLEGLLREIRIAENVSGADHYADLERKVMEVIGRIHMSQIQEAQRSFSEAISLATTSCQAAMNSLQEKRLV